MSAEQEAARQLAADLRALGVRKGGVLLAHSSLSALGQVPGGAETVIEALLEALGADGTLLMPALSYRRVTREHPVFSLLLTPSNVGVIPETFRVRPGALRAPFRGATLRSLHPTHSVSAAGPLAGMLTERHGEDRTPCGPNSPFRLLPEHNGQLLMLGCGLRPNTSMHAVEELIVPPYLFGPPLEYTLVDAAGVSAVHSYTTHNFTGFRQRYDRLSALLPPSALRRGPALAGEAHLIETPAMWEAALAALRTDPLAFVEPIE